MTNINHQTNNIHYVMTVSMHTINILFSKQPIILFTNDQPELIMYISVSNSCGITVTGSKSANTRLTL